MGLHPFPPQHCRQSSIPVAARAVQTPWRPAEVVRARVRGSGQGERYLEARRGCSDLASRAGRGKSEDEMRRSERIRVRVGVGVRVGVRRARVRREKRWGGSGRRRVAKVCVHRA